MDTKDFFNLNGDFIEARAAMFNEARRLLAAFIVRHGKEGKANIKALFVTPDDQERTEPVYVFRERCDDRCTLEEEKLTEISSSKASEMIYVNGEPLFSWMNGTVVPDVVACAEEIEKDVDCGDASFEDGVLAYKEDKQ